VRKRYEGEIPEDLMKEARGLYFEKYGVELIEHTEYLSDNPLCGQDAGLMISLFGREKLKAYCMRYCDKLEASLKEAWLRGERLYMPCKIIRGEFKGQLGVVLVQGDISCRVYDLVTGFDKVISTSDIKSRVWRVGERGAVERMKA
jgi:hypothetical protein